LKQAPFHTEKELLARVAGGDENAFREIYDRYRKRIYALGMHLTGSEIMAEEILQDVFVKTWTNRAKLPSIDYFNSWLRKVTQNTVYDYLRSLAVEQLGLERLSAQSPTSSPNTIENNVFAKELEGLLQQAIAQLPAQQQKVYLLHKKEEMTHDAIAKEMGLGVETVRSYMKLALRNVRQFIDARIELSVVIAIAIYLSGE
jgi:RNA polymerase sigma-70 factor (ECF subfamily)